MDDFCSIISFSLKKAFPSYNVYLERPDDMRRPAFFVQCIDEEQRKSLGNRYLRKGTYGVHVFPSGEIDSAYQALWLMKDDLYSALEWMEFQGQRLRSFNVKSRISDNVLQIFFDCGPFITEKKQWITWKHWSTALCQGVNRRETDMAGGIFLTQNKKLPGAYINFKSVPAPNAVIGNRGIAALALPLSWGPQGEMLTLLSSDLVDGSSDIKVGYGSTTLNWTEKIRSCYNEKERR